MQYQYTILTRFSISAISENRPCAQPSYLCTGFRSSQILPQSKKSTTYSVRFLQSELLCSLKPSVLLECTSQINSALVLLVSRNEQRQIFHKINYQELLKGTICLHAFNGANSGILCKFFGGKIAQHNLHCRFPLL